MRKEILITLIFLVFAKMAHAWETFQEDDPFDGKTTGSFVFSDDSKGWIRVVTWENNGETETQVRLNLGDNHICPEIGAYADTIPLKVKYDDEEVLQFNGWVSKSREFIIFTTATQVSDEIKLFSLPEYTIIDNLEKLNKHNAVTIRSYDACGEIHTATFNITGQAHMLKSDIKIK